MDSTDGFEDQRLLGFPLSHNIWVNPKDMFLSDSPERSEWNCDGRTIDDDIQHYQHYYDRRQVHDYQYKYSQMNFLNFDDHKLNSRTVSTTSNDNTEDAESNGLCLKNYTPTVGKTSACKISTGHATSSNFNFKRSYPDCGRKKEIRLKSMEHPEDGKSRVWSSASCSDRSGLAHSLDFDPYNKGNQTESVRVASSFHVAEIVGKQGTKIKRIRAMTNTWIKTPARGDEPVFVISGRKEGVEQAKTEILAAAEKVARLRALRCYASEGHNLIDSPHVEMNEATSVQIKVNVPANAVGLIIGPKGSRIKQIAEATSTYIKTPSKNREPVFEIVGQPKDALTAKQYIVAFTMEKLDDDYVRNYMDQLPIHEPGSPVTISPSPPAMKYPSSSTHPNDFTKLKPFRTWNAPTPVTSISPRCMSDDTFSIAPHAATFDSVSLNFAYPKYSPLRALL